MHDNTLYRHHSSHDTIHADDNFKNIQLHVNVEKTRNAKLSVDSLCWETVVEVLYQNLEFENSYLGNISWQKWIYDTLW